MQLRDVLEQQDLHLRMLTDDRALDRRLSQVYTTDLLDSGRYLTGDEMVLTGMMWWHDPADSERFVSTLTAAGVAALGAGEGLLGTVPADLIEACLRHGLPLFAVPADVSFRDIADRVNALLWAQREAAAINSRSHQHGRVSALAAGAELAEVWPADAQAWVLTCTGRVIAGPPLPAAARLARAYLQAGTLPARQSVEGRQFQLAELPGASRLGTRFVVAAVDYGPLDELVQLAALDHAQHVRVRQVEQRLAGQLVDLLAAQAGPADVAAAMHACRLDTRDQHMVLVASVGGQLSAAQAGAAEAQAGTAENRGVSLRAPQVEAQAGTAENRGVSLRAPQVEAQAGPAETIIEELLHPRRAAIGSSEDLTVAVVPTDDPQALLADLRAAATALQESMRGRPLAIGASAAASEPAGLPAALVSARHAHSYLLRRGGTTRVLSSGELASHELLLASVPLSVRTAFAEQLLAPLRAYDTAHHADLLRTLDTFLSLDGSWSRCASSMHLHVNTLRYRLQRIEHLTGRDLTRFSDRVDFYLALRQG